MCFTGEIGLATAVKRARPAGFHDREQFARDKGGRIPLTIMKMGPLDHDQRRLRELYPHHSDGLPARVAPRVTFAGEWTAGRPARLVAVNSAQNVDNVVTDVVR